MQPKNVTAPKKLSTKLRQLRPCILKNPQGGHWSSLVQGPFTQQCWALNRDKENVPIPSLKPKCSEAFNQQTAEVCMSLSSLEMKPSNAKQLRCKAPSYKNKIEQSPISSNLLFQIRSVSLSTLTRLAPTPDFHKGRKKSGNRFEWLGCCGHV